MSLNFSPLVVHNLGRRTCPSLPCDPNLALRVILSGYFTVHAEENLLTFVTDKTMSLTELQRFVNRVAGRIARVLPGAFVSASLKVKTCEHEAAGGGACGRRLPPALWYEDARLVSAGGDPLGVLSIVSYANAAVCAECMSMLRNLLDIVTLVRLFSGIAALRMSHDLRARSHQVRISLFALDAIWTRTPRVAY
eukprot:6211254-Pleurochrysis_carterae.AAC.1